ncbi:hypothetical protein C8Q79DRAFT_121833 [Trametes meyenii]|nr:hypothetical protein C8Q79DRAFT_121833 [Trametes meyenii]
MEPVPVSRQVRPEGPIRTNSSGRAEDRAGSSVPYPQPSASGMKPSTSGPRGTRYKDKFLALRDKYDTVTATHEDLERQLVRADEKLKRLQEECNLLLDAVDIAVPAQPTLVHYLKRDPIPPQYYSHTVPVPANLPPEATIPQHFPSPPRPLSPPPTNPHAHPHGRPPSPPPPMHMQHHTHPHPLSRSHSHAPPPSHPHPHPHGPPQLMQAPPPHGHLQPVRGIPSESAAKGTDSMLLLRLLALPCCVYSSYG